MHFKSLAVPFNRLGDGTLASEATFLCGFRLPRISVTELGMPFSETRSGPVWADAARE